MKLSKIITGLLLAWILGAAFPVCADGFIVVTKPGPRPHTRVDPFPLIVEYHHVTVAIEDRAATTSVDQVFYNPGNRRMEGYYLFPLPRNAVRSSFGMKTLKSWLPKK